MRVITYGSFDLFHQGHLNLLKRAKALGDYLIVGVTSDSYDKSRGKINITQSLMERIESVKATGLADMIIIEEYEGQKIDDIRKYNVDIFTVGTDWEGYFDYLNEYCKVIYLERTSGISSSDIRDSSSHLTLGLVGDALFLDKIYNEASYVNGLEVKSVFTHNESVLNLSSSIYHASSFSELLNQVESVYICSHPDEHYTQIKEALNKGKHVICESPIANTKNECNELFTLASNKNLILMEGIKTAYSTAFFRLKLLLKGKIIGDIVSVDATCTSLRNDSGHKNNWGCLYEWGPTALLPVFQLLGTDYIDKHVIARKTLDNNPKNTDFLKMDFIYKNAIGTIKIGDGVKSESELIISGTKGYVYVPAPWWKTDYFEVRFEDANNNKRYFYHLDGEGIRNEFVAFSRSVIYNTKDSNIDFSTSMAISNVMENIAPTKVVCLEN